jgi:hypothetical protein
MEDIYGKLREHLDSFPTGYPKKQSDIELRILEKALVIHLLSFRRRQESSSFNWFWAPALNHTRYRARFHGSDSPVEFFRRLLDFGGVYAGSL